MGDLLVSMGATLASLKTIFDLTKTAVDAHDAGVAREKLIEIQREIFAAQQKALSAQVDQFALLDRVRTLEKELTDHEAWDATAAQYKVANLRQPTDPRGPLFVYSPKQPEGQLASPVHHVCTQCFEQRHISILQSERLYPGAADVLICHRCSSILYVNGHREPEHVNQFPKRSSH